MISRPLIPGRAYRVRGHGVDLIVLAKSSMAALCAVIDLFVED